MPGIEEINQSYVTDTTAMVDMQLPGLAEPERQAKIAAVAENLATLDGLLTNRYLRELREPAAYIEGDIVYDKEEE